MYTKVQAAKRARLCESIAAAISLEEKLPEKVRGLLSAMVPGSLGTAPAERHEHQAAAAALLGKALCGVETDLQSDLEAVEAALAKSEEEKAALLSKQSSVEEELKQKQEDVASKTQAVEAAKSAHQASKTAAADAETALVEAEAVPAALQTEKTECNTVAVDNLAPLNQPGAAADAAEVKRHLAALLPVCERTSMGFSLLSSVPTAALQAVESRSQFNSMVMTELQRELSEHIELLASKLAEATAVVEAKKKALEAAVAERSSCEHARESAEAALDTAVEQRKESEAALAAAKLAVKEHGPRLAQANADGKAARKALSAFRGTALKQFRTLEEQAAQPAEGEAGEEETAAASTADKAAALPGVVRTPVESLGA